MSAYRNVLGTAVLFGYACRATHQQLLASRAAQLEKMQINNLYMSEVNCSSWNTHH